MFHRAFSRRCIAWQDRYRQISLPNPNIHKQNVGVSMCVIGSSRFHAIRTCVVVSNAKLRTNTWISSTMSEMERTHRYAAVFHMSAASRVRVNKWWPRTWFNFRSICKYFPQTLHSQVSGIVACVSREVSMASRRLPKRFWSRKWQTRQLLIGRRCDSLHE